MGTSKKIYYFKLPIQKFKNYNRINDISIHYPYKTFKNFNLNIYRFTRSDIQHKKFKNLNHFEEFGNLLFFIFRYIS